MILENVKLGKNKKLDQKSTWTQIVRYTYGVSSPEALVSDLVSNGIIRELYLDVLVETFDNWLTKYLVLEMKKLKGQGV